MAPSPLIFNNGVKSRDLDLGIWYSHFHVQQTVEVESPVEQIVQNALLVHINRTLDSQQSRFFVNT